MGDWGRVLGCTGDGAHEEELVDGVLAMVNVAAAQAVSLLEIDR